MKAISIFNEVLGPVMRGPSSSHTAASFRIGKIARELLGDQPSAVRISFDQYGSYAKVYRQQGSDLAFAAGLMGWSITDERFSQSLKLAAAQNLQIDFKIENLSEADHPNTVKIEATSQNGHTLVAVAKSIGGGAIVFTQLGDWQIYLTGDAHEVLVELDPEVNSQVMMLLREDAGLLANPDFIDLDGRGLLHARHYKAINPDVMEKITSLPGVTNVWTTPPIVFTIRGEPVFSSATEMVDLASEKNQSLGQTALSYEAELLGLSEDDILQEMVERLNVMRASVKRGLEEEDLPMQLLHPSARKIYQADAQGKLPTGGLHTRAAARAMAVMHINGGMGVVCAAPTAGSAGVIPGVVVTLVEELGLSKVQAAYALLAASAIGLVIAQRATFAAEVAGCQVEIGASSAMAAAAVVEAAGGNARQATDAAAIVLQNTMGSVCDPVQGVVEIPCHTRNAVGASSAFVCADLVIGGYQNPIPLDETVDTMYQVGKMLPQQLKCTALGGLAQAPSALIIPLRSL